MKFVVEVPASSVDKIHVDLINNGEEVALTKFYSPNLLKGSLIEHDAFGGFDRNSTASQAWKDSCDEIANHFPHDCQPNYVTVYLLITPCKSYAGDVNAKVQPVAHHIRKQSNKGRCEYFLVVNLNSIVDIDLTTRVEDEDEVVVFDDDDDDDDDAYNHRGRQDEEKEQMKLELRRMREKLKEMEKEGGDMDCTSYSGMSKSSKIESISEKKPTSLVVSPGPKGFRLRKRKAKSFKDIVVDFDQVTKTIASAVKNMN